MIEMLSQTLLLANAAREERLVLWIIALTLGGIFGCGAILTHKDQQLHDLNSWLDSEKERRVSAERKLEELKRSMKPEPPTDA